MGFLRLRNAADLSAALVFGGGSPASLHLPIDTDVI
jgi:hypothetical protein